MTINCLEGTFFVDRFEQGLRNDCVNVFGSDYISTVVNNNIYLDHHRIMMDEQRKERVVEFIAEKAAENENVKRVFTAEQLYNSSIDDEWMSMAKNGFHHAESGDLVFVLEPGYLPKTTDTELSRKGTSHGSAFNYDTHVPLLWYGKNIPQKEVYRKIDITDIAATLAHLLYLQMPSATTGEVILEVFSNE